MHWSGCPAGCGNHQAADIGFRGMKVNVGDKIIDAVAIYTGGRPGPDASAGKEILEVVPCDGSLPDVIAELINRLGLLERREPERAEFVPLEALASAPQLPMQPSVGGD
jgi:ferredoxin-nitrite reductase